jgi:ABC-type molybdate transport system substrate-binding protein
VRRALLALAVLTVSTAVQAQATVFAACLRSPAGQALLARDGFEAPRP